MTLTIGRGARRARIDTIWHAVGVYAKDMEDGALHVRALIFSPDWDEPLQVASLREEKSLFKGAV